MVDDERDLSLQATTVQIDGNRVRWFSGAARVDIELSGPVESFLIDDERDVIALLCLVPHNHKRFVSVHDAHGAFIREFAEPPDVHFNCLGEHVRCRLAVMTKAYHHGWGDWWYGLDIESGRLLL
jgi:hypothetical protein